MRRIRAIRPKIGKRPGIYVILIYYITRVHVCCYAGRITFKLRFRLTEWLKFLDHVVIDIIYQAKPGNQVIANERVTQYKKGNYKLAEPVGGPLQRPATAQKPTCGYLADQVKAAASYYHGHVTPFSARVG